LGVATASDYVEGDDRRRALTLVYRSMDQANITLVSASEAVGTQLGEGKSPHPVPQSFRFGAMPSLICHGERLKTPTPSTTSPLFTADHVDPLVPNPTRFSIFQAGPGIVCVSIIVLLAGLLGFVWGKLKDERNDRIQAEEACDGYETWIQYDETAIPSFVASTVASQSADTEHRYWPITTTQAGSVGAPLSSVASVYPFSREGTMRTGPLGTSIAPLSREGTMRTGPLGTSIAPLSREGTMRTSPLASIAALSSRGGSRAPSLNGAGKAMNSKTRSISSLGAFGRTVVVVLEKAQLWSLVGARGENGPLMIVHECLLTLFDSPLQKDGRLTVFMHSDENDLVEVHPSFVVPRNFDLFQRLINALLHQGEVGGDSLRPPMMRCIEPPVEQYFPLNCTCFGLSQEGRPENLRKIAEEADNGDACYVFAVGASEGDALLEETMFGGDYAGNRISISPHELTAAAVCQMVCTEFSEYWVKGSPEDGESSVEGTSIYF